MIETKQRLRSRFEAETDVVVEHDNEAWKQYAEWLENLAVEKINNELARENALLLNKMREALKALEQGIEGG